MKDKITLSINPLYQCNLRCNFCYLSREQLSSKQIISAQQLFEKLTEVSLYRQIDHVDLYGGEIALLKNSHLEELLGVIKIFFQDKINLITNLTHVPEVFHSEDIEISVSWDYFARENWEKVYSNMKSLNKKFHILILASSELVEMEDRELDAYIKLLNELPYLVSVEIKPYSKNKYNQWPVSFLQFENWVKKWIERSNHIKFQLINIDKIINSLNRNYTSWSDDHLYITPSGNYSVLEFDENQNEFFLELQTFSEYIDWTRKEKMTVSENVYCKSCKYLGHCLSEHLQSVNDISQSCNGFRNLLDWYADARL